MDDEIRPSDVARIVSGALVIVLIFLLTFLTVKWWNDNKCYSGKYLYTTFVSSCTKYGCTIIPIPVYETICKGDKDFDPNHK